LPQLEDFDGEIMVLCGDVPLIPRETLSGLIEYHKNNEMCATVLTVELPDPGRYGRIVRDSNNYLSGIVEAADANEEQLAIREINSGTYIFDKVALFKFIEMIDSDNAQGEFYITDIIEIMRDNDCRVGAFLFEGDIEMLSGVNKPEDLQNLENYIKRKKK
jgi:bifunctional UDP-N-acetylglucosamine pyrophosphorylase/glucosamine-1-phosphate N-acetyltransferase